MDEATGQYGAMPIFESLEARLLLDGAAPIDPGDIMGVAHDMGSFGDDASHRVASQTIGDGAYGAADVDLYRITLAQTGTLIVDVDAQAIGSGLDAYLRIFEDFGAEIIYNDDSDGTDPYISWGLPDGTYYVGVSGYPNSSYDPAIGGSGGASTTTGSYDLRIISASTLVTIPDAALEQAIANETIMTLPPFSQADMLLLTGLSAGSKSITDLTGLDFASNLGTLTLSNNRISDISPIDDLTKLTQVSLDQNYLYLGPGSPAAATIYGLQEDGVSVNYSAQFEPGDAMDIAYDLGSFGDDTAQRFSAQTIGDGPYVASDVDFYKITLAQAGKLIVDVDGVSIGSSLDAYLRLFSSAGVQIGYNDDTDGHDPYISSDLAAGTYYVGVSGYPNYLYDPATSGSGSPSVTTGAYELRVVSDLSPVTIPDAGLEQAIRDELTIPTAPLTVGDMLSLTTLDASISGIGDLTGLEFATNLNTLDLSFNQITDISPLAGLSSLTDLALNNNEISDLTPMVALTDLDYLDLGANYIASPAPLAGLTGLTRLDLSSNHITNITSLAGLVNLELFGLYGNYLYLGPGSPAMSVITGLQAGGTYFDIVSHQREPGDATSSAYDMGSFGASVVHRVQSQEIGDGFYGAADVDFYKITLAAPGTLIADVDAESIGSGLDATLRLFDVAGLQIAYNDDAVDHDPYLSETLTAGTYYVGVSGYPNIAYAPATAGTGAVSDTTGEYTLRLVSASSVVTIPDPFLEQAVRDALTIPAAPLTQADMLSLEILLAWGGVVDLTGLEFATNMHILSAGDGVNQIVNVAPLADLKKLTSVELADNQITDVSLLAGLTRLTGLGLAGNNIVNVAPLASLTDLESLALGDNQIVDITPLTVLTKLTWLGLNDNQITSVTPLTGMTRLQILHLLENQITDITPLAGLTDLEYLDMHGNWISNLLPLVGLTKLTHLNVSDGLVVDVSPVAGLANLTTLRLSANQITDITPLAGLPNPASLWLEVEDNYLYLGPGSPTMAVVTSLQATGTTVQYVSQREPGDTMSIAYDLGSFGDSVVHRVAPQTIGDGPFGAFDVDFFEITLAQAGTLIADVDAEAISGLDAHLGLFTSGGILIAFDDDTDGHDPYLSSALSAGTYYVGVSGYPNDDYDPTVGGSGSEPSITTGAYELRIVSGSSLVTIPDPGLEQAVRSELTIPSAPLTQADMLSLGSLGAGDREIVDLTGLEFAVNLTHMDAPRNKIVSLTPLAGLRKLDVLHLTGNRIVDLSPLAGMAVLRNLSLNGNLIADITPLGSLTNLQMLLLDVNQIANITPLASLTKLNYLDLHANQISVVTPLAGLTGLGTLRLERNQIVDITPLAGLTSLHDLSLAYNQIVNISPLVGMTSLLGLNLYSNRIVNIASLAALTSMSNLDMRVNLVSDLSPLSALSGLVYLKADANRLTNIAPLGGMTNLLTLGLVDNYLYLGPGSPAMTVIGGLQTAGTTVTYLTQLEPGDATSIAYDMGSFGDSVVHRVESQAIGDGPYGAADVDLYEITLALGGTLIVDVDAEAIGSGLDAMLRLFSAGGFELAVSNDHDGLDPYLSASLGAGTYYVGVSGYPNGAYAPAVEGSALLPSDTTGAYELRIVSGSSVVTIPDPFLEQAIRDDLIIPVAPLTQADMLSLGLLRALGGVADLTGLEFAANLHYLIADDTLNHITDVTPLAGLTKLTRLHLEHNNIVNIAPLAGLVNLDGLYLDDNQISDITPLAGLTELLGLYLEDNLISNVAPLAGLPKLDGLFLGGNQITNIAPLGSLTTLTSLSLEDNNVSNLSPLAGLTDMVMLELGGNNISNLTPLTSLTKLTWLGLSTNQIVDITPVGALTGLLQLNVANNQIANITAVSTLVEMMVLYARFNQISDITPVLSLPDLWQLDLGGNLINAAPSLLGLTRLDYVWLDDNRFTDISSLADMTILDDLWLGDNYLYLGPGSSATPVIAGLQTAGVFVDYLAQREPGDGMDIAYDMGSFGVNAVQRMAPEEIGDGPYGPADVDLYKVTLAQGGTLIVDVDAATIDSGLDAMLRIFSAAGVQVAANNDYDGVDPYLSPVLPAGTYYVGVSGQPNEIYNPQVAGSGTVSSTIGPYELRIMEGNDPPTDIAMAGGSVLENDADGPVAGTLSGSDPENDPLIFVLSDDAGGRFEIIGTDIVVAAGVVLDYETASSHQVTVDADDGSGEFAYSEVFTINVINVLDDDDYNALVSSFGLRGSGLPADLNGDGRVSLIDFALLRANFGDPWVIPAPLPAPEAPSAAPEPEEPIAQAPTPAIPLASDPLDDSDADDDPIAPAALASSVDLLFESPSAGACIPESQAARATTLQHAAADEHDLRPLNDDPVTDDWTDDFLADILAESALTAPL
ncbi:MAG: DVUA0089 family protein [Phycisphaerae bacterium]|jgi:Leucine-rich repeat (LRR) protein|nr:DVUA0089 family protein [Phycisphaerae bacterium]